MAKEIKTEQAHFPLYEGDRIAWQYTHTLGRSRIERVKYGTFVRRVESREGSHTKHGTDQIVVKFDGNKSSSTVWIQDCHKILSE